MTAIIDDQVEWPPLANYALQKNRIGLRADSDVDLVRRIVKFTTSLIDVYPHHNAIRAEKITPQFQRGAIVNPDLKHPQRFSAKVRKLAIIDRKVVNPFVSSGYGFPNPPGGCKAKAVIRRKFFSRPINRLSKCDRQKDKCFTIESGVNWSKNRKRTAP